MNDEINFGINYNVHREVGPNVTNVPVHCSNRCNAVTQIAYFIAMLSGTNKAELIATYDPKVSERSDDGTHLRGALGPRMRNWIGVDQYQEAINKNMDVTEISDYQKPEGMDQLYLAFADLQNGLPTTEIIIRDPGVDYTPTLDYPDLVSINFGFIPSVRFGSIDKYLKVAVNYSTINDIEDYFNEYVGLSFIINLYKDWLRSNKVALFVNAMYAEWLEGKNPFDCVFRSYTTVDEIDKICDPDTVMEDFKKLVKAELHLRNMFREHVYKNELINLKRLSDIVLHEFCDKAELNIVKDMILILTVHFLRYDMQTFEEYIIETLIPRINTQWGKAGIGKYMLMLASNHEISLSSSDKESMYTLVGE